MTRYSERGKRVKSSDNKLDRRSIRGREKYEKTEREILREREWEREETMEVFGVNVPTFVFEDENDKIGRRKTKKNGRSTFVANCYR